MRSQALKLTPKRVAESDVNDSVARCLESHPRIAWYQRQNTGASFNVQGQFIRYGVPGNPDFHGQTVEGIYVGVEDKPPGWKPKGAKDKARFRKQLLRLKEINDANGIGILAYCWQDVQDCLDNELALSEMRIQIKGLLHALG